MSCHPKGQDPREKILPWVVQKYSFSNKYSPLIQGATSNNNNEIKIKLRLDNNKIREPASRGGTFPGQTAPDVKIIQGLLESLTVKAQLFEQEI